MSKQWGMRLGISPVLYVHANSFPFQLLDTLLVAGMQSIKKSFDEGKKFSDEDSLLWNALQYSSYVKAYNGNPWNKGTRTFSDEIRRFYNEREWRYVPNSRKEILDTQMSVDAFLSPDEMVREVMTRLAADFQLKFEPKDIEYIIIKSDSELLEMKGRIRDLKGRYSFDDVELLTTKFISTEKIFRDF